MSAPSAETAKPKRKQRAKGESRSYSPPAESLLAQLAAARLAKQAKRDARLKLRLEAGPRPVAKHGESAKPGKGSMAQRYYVQGQIEQKHLDAAVEYKDLHLRLSDAKIGGYGFSTHGSSGGSDGPSAAVIDRRRAARAAIKRANKALERLPPPIPSLVYAVCVDDWAAGTWLREYEMDGSSGLKLLTRGLDALAAHWQLPARKGRPL